MKFKICESEVKGKFASEQDFWDKLKAGFEVEKEHAETVNNCPITTTKIALDHLAEDIEYYAKLKKMESGDQPKDEEKKEDKDEEKDEEKEDEKDEEDEEEKSSSVKV